MARDVLSSGAESIIFINTDRNIEKDRIPKNYRIPEIDNVLRISRTRKELKVMQSLLKLNLPVPKIMKHSDTIIEMEYIDGIQLKKILDKRPELAGFIGKNLTIMHEHDIIYGDLTTSNMILKSDDDRNIINDLPKKHNADDKHDPHQKNGETLYFIDFGLSFNSKRVEDKAVDVHLFKQALESKHFRVYDEALKYFLMAYDPKDKKEILQRLHSVEQRGRNKEKT